MDNQTFTQYCQQKRQDAPKGPKGEVKHAGDIKKRWDERVVAQGLQLKGKQGAADYLERYGRGIQAPKCIGFALMAEAEGYPDMAQGFWEKAYELEIGRQPVAA